MKTLQLITQDLLNLYQEVELSQGEISQKLEADLKELENSLTTKVDHYAYRIEKLDHIAEFWDMKADQASHISKTIKTHIKNMKDRIKSTLKVTDKREVVGESYVIKTRPTAKLKVHIFDESLIPPEFKTLVQEWKPNKDIIRAELEAGRNIPGCYLEQTDTLTISLNKSH